MTVYTTSIPSIFAIREQVAELVSSGQPLAAKTLVNATLRLVEQALTPALDADTAATIVAAKRHALDRIHLLANEAQPWDNEVAA